MTKKDKVEVQPEAPETRPLSRSMKSLIGFSNELLAQYQQKLYAEIELAAREEMESLELAAEDGWRIDLSAQVYLKAG